MGLLIVFLPAIIILIALVFKPPEKVFQNFYLPVLLLFPQNFTFHLNRIPDVSFAQTAIMPLFVFGFLSRIHRWKWSITDFILLVFFMEMIYSEYEEEGIGSTAQLITSLLTNMVFPYVLAKILIHPGGYTISFAKTITLLMYTNVILSVYEQRFMVNPYIQIFQRFFPDQGYEWPSIDRYGLVRISGPFLQPILFAIGCIIAFFLNFWVWRNRYWGLHYRHIPDLPISKGLLFASVLFFGLVFTFSRGPLLALFLGFLFVGIGISKYPWPSFVMRLSIFTIACLVISEIYEFYAGVGTELATSDQAMTLSYRTALVDKYAEITWLKPWFGWGVNSWPKVANTVSIDNQYLWLSLKHGFVGTFLYIVLILNVILRLLKRGFTLHIEYTRERTLNFTFLGMYLTIVFSFATVYMGLQLEALFFLMTGWVEGYVHTHPQNNADWDKLVAIPQKYVQRH